MIQSLPSGSRQFVSNHLTTDNRLRLRGPSGAKDEFLLAATAQNLRKLAKLIPFPAPIFANLFDDEDGEGYTLIWSRPSKRTGD